MIHVQIASQVTAQGVSGVRWVLVEALETPLAPEPEVAVAQQGGPAATAALPAAAGSPIAGAMQLGALKLAVVGLGLGAALWTAQVQVGPPGAGATQPLSPTVPTPHATPATQGQGGAPVLSAPPAQARPLPPAAVPDGASPPPPAASGGLPRLTAAL